MAGHARPLAGTAIFHKLYALDTVLDGLHTPTKVEVEAAIAGHVIAQAELVGTYKK
jgi:hypothetical protein